MNKPGEIYLTKKEFTDFLAKEFPKFDINGEGEVYIKRERIGWVFPNCYGLYSKPLYLGKISSPDKDKNYVNMFSVIRNGVPTKKTFCSVFNKNNCFAQVKESLNREMASISAYAATNGMENAVSNVWVKPFGD
jgi:hypothetical protein